jgi:hypothetical protein
MVATSIVIRGADSDSQVGDNYGERSEPKKYFCVCNLWRNRFNGAPDDILILKKV